MKNWKVNWNQIVHFSKFKNGYEGLLNHHGIYLFVYPTKNGCQIYYVGKTNNFNKRIQEHYKRYINATYWLPSKIEYFDDDIYKIHRLKSKDEYLKYYSRPDGSKSLKKVGEYIVNKTLIILSNVDEEPDCVNLALIESLIIMGIQKKCNLPVMGWMGDSALKFTSDNVSVTNNFDSKEIKDILSLSLPEKIIYQLSIRN
ncbi:MAG: GIY-YIG nuclease family protein [Spirochaetes bacterium]|nr:GIY-YIG nuclease family protein [Spirochaetota bacterium]